MNRKRIKIIRATTIPMSLRFFCNGMLEKLSEKYEVIALSSPGEDLKVVADREGVKTIAIPMERRISFVKDIKALLKLIQVFHNEKPTIVHSMTPKAGLLCMIAAWFTRVPIRIHTFTGLVFPTTTGLKRKVLMLTDKITCSCATHVIPEGEGVKKDLLTNGITKKSLKVLGYGNVKGVDMNYYSRNEEVEALADNLRDSQKFTFLFVGRIVRAKGIDELVIAFEKLYQTYPEIRLFLVGPYENDLDPISQSSQRIIDSKKNIIAVGMKTGIELLAYYAASDCFVFPSYREGFPNTVLEAGAMGLPSIVTDINGSREIIKEGENGMIVPPHDSERLFEAMSEILANKEKREMMAGNARGMIASRYEQGYVRQCLYDFYDEVLSSIKKICYIS